MNESPHTTRLGLVSTMKRIRHTPEQEMRKHNIAKCVFSLGRLLICSR